ncbi:conjugal transfer protein TraI [Arthrospiribacter ruber]|uniref:Conjugal transfer protein TraI n=1 Tax=Arthrospiribacter ruber TaxID=2487934 RepID=A0A951IVK7_9BACT|nr:conjugal transfer protein TraI [Arthrospiribacter ruber]MBW3466847.1 conjugal transfer protein TraI [Arthrospiribacter ruber]
MKPLFRKVGRKVLKFITCLLLSACVGIGNANATSDPISEIIKAGVKRVIIAVDLQIQRRQNEVIWLQNAQKVIENTLSKLRLEEIQNWTQRQQELYSDYYESLWKVRSLLQDMQMAKETVELQKALVEEYMLTWQFLNAEPLFVAAELLEIQRMYGRILSHSLENVQQLSTLMKDYSLKMEDGQRIRKMEEIRDNTALLLADTRRVNAQLTGLHSMRKSQLQQGKSFKKLLP